MTLRHKGVSTKNNQTLYPGESVELGEEDGFDLGPLSLALEGTSRGKGGKKQAKRIQRGHIRRTAKRREVPVERGGKETVRSQGKGKGKNVKDNVSKRRKERK